MRSFQDFADTKVNQLGDVVRVKNDVLRLDVSVKNALIVAVLQALGYLSDLFLDSGLHDHAIRINQLMVCIRLKCVRLWIPI